MANSAMTLAEPLQPRDDWTATGSCPMERALDLVGTRSAMMLLREVFYGGRRFDDLVRRTGVTEAVASQRLRQLVEAGVLARSPYREPGQRMRHEYVLTDRGRELFPVLVGLMRFGQVIQGEHPGALNLVHDGCGARVEPRVRCDAGHDVPLTDVVVTLDPPKDAPDPDGGV